MISRNSIGIDPGLTGAIALLNPDGKLLALADMPTCQLSHGKKQVDVWQLANVISKFSHWDSNGGCAVVEKVNAMPGQGVVSMFSFGVSYGMVLGVLAMGGIPYELVTPQRWKKRVNLIGQDKDASRQLASRLYPDCDWSLKRYHNRAESIFIGLAGGQYNER